MAALSIKVDLPSRCGELSSTIFHVNHKAQSNRITMLLILFVFPPTVTYRSLEEKCDNANQW